MSVRRANEWMENLGEWSWPGRGGVAAEALLPPSWVPTFPPRLEAATPIPASAPWQAQRTIPRALIPGALLSGVAAACAALALHGPLSLARLAGLASARSSISRAVRLPVASGHAASPAQALPTLLAQNHAAAGSMIDTASYYSPALHGRGSFLVYLPAGFASTTRHYPVLYLLHGNDQQASAFLQIGLQGALDRLIARQQIPPLIAVMIQGGRGANNWRDLGAQRYESYVLEVQELIDRILPTVAKRDARAIAGDSMGGYGAMNVALGNPYRFSVVESWLGFFNGLEDELRADQPIISRMGLRAFLYGGESDHIADPTEDATFAAELRAAGAYARSAVYAGGHSLETLEAHLTRMLFFAGRAFAEGG
ncbi:MAG: alpha/beta hydrolase-fold protein [Solirubrobacteraceae bacterium]